MTAAPFRRVLACCLFLAGPALAGDTKGLADWVAARFPQVRRATLEQCLSQAAREGLLVNPAMVAEVKRTFLRAQRAASTAPDLRPGSGPVHTTGRDTESNDTLAWADDLGNGIGTATGDINPPGDRDVFRLVTTGDTTLQLTTAAWGPTPILDTVLTLLDDRGQVVAVNDNQGSGLYSGLRTTLAAGTYYAQVEGYGAGAGGYQLSAVATPVVIPVAQSGVPLALRVFGPGHEDAMRLVLPVESLIRVQCSGAGPTFDPYLCLSRERGGRIFTIDNAGTGGGSDPGLQVVLPAGSYLLTLGSMLGGGVVTSTATVLPATVPSLPCNGLRVGTILGEESRDCYRFYSATATRVALVTAPAGSAPVADTVVEFYDRDLVRIARNDDDQNGLFGSLDLPLPAGLYFVVVRGGFNATGNYSVANQCLTAQPPSPLANGRSTLVVTGAGQTAERIYRLGTPCPVQFQTDASLATLTLPQLALLDDTGHALLSDLVGMGPHGAAFGGVLLAAGDYHLLLRDETGASGNCRVVAAPPLYLDPRWPTASLNSVDKSGRLLVLMASTSVGPGIPLGPGPVSGVFLLSPAPLFVVDVVGVPQNGSHQWPFVLAGEIPPMQALSLDPLLLQGWLGNLER